ncbi:hypothetical protein OXX80_006970 [Metschnikowia pulcherrima]
MFSGERCTLRHFEIFKARMRPINSCLKKSRGKELSKFKSIVGTVFSSAESIGVGVITKRLMELEESERLEPLKDGRSEEEVERELAVEFSVRDLERDLLR